MSDRNARAAAALQRLHELGAIRSPWLAGMRLGRVPSTNDNGHWLYVRLGDTFVQPCDGREWVPDTTDPLTVAALGLLAREAWGGAPMSAVRERGAAWIIANGLCDSMLAGGRYFRGDTEADAWIAALEARVVALGTDAR